MSIKKHKSNTINFIRLIFFGTFLSIGFQSQGQVTEKNYKVYSVKLNKEVSEKFF